jgi:hypothetical protein
MPYQLLQLVLALRSLVAFHIGLGVSTTDRLVRTEGGAALGSLGAQKSLPEVLGLSFLVVQFQGYFKGRRLIGLFLIWAELRYNAREKPKNGEIGGF